MDCIAVEINHDVSSTSLDVEMEYPELVSTIPGRSSVTWVVETQLPERVHSLVSLEYHRVILW